MSNIKMKDNEYITLFRIVENLNRKEQCEIKKFCAMCFRFESEIELVDRRMFYKVSKLLSLPAKKSLSEYARMCKICNYNLQKMLKFGEKLKIIKMVNELLNHKSSICSNVLITLINGTQVERGCSVLADHIKKLNNQLNQLLSKKFIVSKTLVVSCELDEESRSNCLDEEIREKQTRDKRFDVVKIKDKPKERLTSQRDTQDTDNKTNDTVINPLKNYISNDNDYKNDSINHIKLHSDLLKEELTVNIDESPENSNDNAVKVENIEQEPISDTVSIRSDNEGDDDTEEYVDDNSQNVTESPSASQKRATVPLSNILRYVMIPLSKQKPKVQNYCKDLEIYEVISDTDDDPVQDQEKEPDPSEDWKIKTPRNLDERIQNVDKTAYNVDQTVLLEEGDCVITAPSLSTTNLKCQKEYSISGQDDDQSKKIAINQLRTLLFKKELFSRKRKYAHSSDPKILVKTDPNSKRTIAKSSLNRKTIKEKFISEGTNVQKQEICKNPLKLENVLLKDTFFVKEMVEKLKQEYMIDTQITQRLHINNEKVLPHRNFNSEGSKNSHVVENFKKSGNTEVVQPSGTSENRDSEIIVCDSSDSDT